MSFRHTFNMRAEPEKLTIDCSDDRNSHDKSKPLRGLAAIHAVLVCHCNMTDKVDLEEQKNASYEVTSITVKGAANVIIALDFLLSEQASRVFYLHSSHLSLEQHKQQWRNTLGKRIVACLDNNNLSVGDLQRLRPILRAYLDAHYASLKKEGMFAALSVKAIEHDGENLLKHPLYQALSLISEDFLLRQKTYNNLGFLDRLQQSAPDEKAYHALCKKYLDVLPACYVDRVQTSSSQIDTVFNAEKLKQSRITAVQTPQPSRLSHGKP